MEGNDHIVIVGTGAEARVAADIFTAQDMVVLGFITLVKGDETREINDINIFAELDSEDAKSVLNDEHIAYTVAIGDIPERKKIYEKLVEKTKRPCSNAIHPTAWVSPYAKTGFGNIVGPHSSISANAGIGDLNHIFSGVNIEADAKIGHYCTISAGVKIGSNVEIEDGVFIGTGAIIHPGVKLGKGSLIGAGSVVLREVPPKKSVFGNPAQEL